MNPTSWRIHKHPHATLPAHLFVNLTWYQQAKTPRGRSFTSQKSISFGPRFRNFGRHPQKASEQFWTRLCLKNSNLKIVNKLQTSGVRIGAHIVVSGSECWLVFKNACYLLGKSVLNYNWLKLQVVQSLTFSTNRGLHYRLANGFRLRMSVNTSTMVWQQWNNVRCATATRDEIKLVSQNMYLIHYRLANRFPLRMFVNTSTMLRQQWNDIRGAMMATDEIKLSSQKM